MKAILATLICFTFVSLLKAADDQLSKEEMKQFLLNARVVNSRQSSKGITNPWRLTLSDGTVTHEASFQSVDEHKTKMEFDDGHIELDFVDSYKYNLAAYKLAEILGLEDIMQVYVERKWNGRSGPLS